MIDKQSARFERYSENCDKCAGLGEITRFYGGGIYDSTIECDQCLGRGEVGNCKRCGGTGEVAVVDDSGKPTVVREECPDCLGVGAIGDCPDCGGTGLVNDGEKECPVCQGFGFIEG